MKEKLIKLYLSVSRIQKVFILILVFNLVSGGDWIHVIDSDPRLGLPKFFNGIYSGVNVTCIFGFLLFWKSEKD